ncbi:RNA 2',3'-cyclic phosphodiesterase [Caldicellulosiruptoraceae bacterium PP1]
MRSFIGVDFPKSLKEQIIEAQNCLKSISIKGRWKYIDNFHLTLKFLGEIEIESINKIHNILSEILLNTKGFTLQIDSCAYFKGNGNLRVVYLKPSKNLDKLFDLYNKIENAMYELGFEKEKRPYTPHITIAQDVVLKDDFQLFRNFIENKFFEQIEIDKIILFDSKEVNKKRIYTPIFTISLE